MTNADRNDIIRRRIREQDGQWGAVVEILAGRNAESDTIARGDYITSGGAGRHIKIIKVTRVSRRGAVYGRRIYKTRAPGIERPWARNSEEHDADCRCEHFCEG